MSFLVNINSFVLAIFFHFNVYPASTAKMIMSRFTYVSVKPTLIEKPRVRILNEFFDTPNRQFPVGTAIQLTCQGEVGSDRSTVRPPLK